jgi:hypothetical protein
VKKSKSYNSKVNTSAGCDLVKKFLCCYTSLQRPPNTPLKEEKLQKSATMAEKWRRRWPTEFVSWRKNEQKRFLLVSSRTLSKQQAVLRPRKKSVQIWRQKASASQPWSTVLIIAKLRAKNGNIWKLAIVCYNVTMQKG